MSTTHSEKRHTSHNGGHHESDSAGEHPSAVSECLDQSKQAAADLERRIEKYIRENPLQSIAIAAGAGLLLGLLIRR